MAERKIRLIDYPNGTFQGELGEQRHPEGRGIFFWNSGDVYFGKWKDGKMSGPGHVFLVFGGRMHGEFKDTLASGPLRLVFPNGEELIGEWCEGVLHGEGMRYSAQDDAWKYGEYRSGELESIQLQGKGRPTEAILKRCFSEWNDEILKTLTDDISVDGQRDCFDGEYRSGKKEGLGTFVFHDGSKYHGVWKDDLPNGLGIFSHISGRVDTGFFRGGLLHGVGRILYNNGSFYYGGFSAGRFEGTGIFYDVEKKKWSYSVFKDNDRIKTLNKGRDLPPPCYWEFHREVLPGKSAEEAFASPELFFLLREDIMLMNGFIFGRPSETEETFPRGLTSGMEPIQEVLAEFRPESKESMVKETEESPKKVKETTVMKTRGTMMTSAQEGIHTLMTPTRQATRQSTNNLTKYLRRLTQKDQPGEKPRPKSTSKTRVSNDHSFQRKKFEKGTGLYWPQSPKAITPTNLQPSLTNIFSSMKREASPVNVKKQASPKDTRSGESLSSKGKISGRRKPMFVSPSSSKRDIRHVAVTTIERSSQTHSLIEEEQKEDIVQIEMKSSLAKLMQFDVADMKDEGPLVSFGGDSENEPAKLHRIASPQRKPLHRMRRSFLVFEEVQPPLPFPADATMEKVRVTEKQPQMSTEKVFAYTANPSPSKTFTMTENVATMSEEGSRRVSMTPQQPREQPREQQREQPPILRIEAFEAVQQSQQQPQPRQLQQSQYLPPPQKFPSQPIQKQQSTGWMNVGKPFVGTSNTNLLSNTPSSSYSQMLSTNYFQRSTARGPFQQEQSMTYHQPQEGGISMGVSYGSPTQYVNMQRLETTPLRFQSPSTAVPCQVKSPMTTLTSGGQRYYIV
eukprot:TRINITY_DN1643_c0_g1_i2.p1 TRINITY_DN1643_c0_g1~~TRINITY_DN1643_c0_g1_i2.p1  ORF type:complete len:848 (+),score=193.14 TRINITY_DN1643_c0_g1_i2:2432-4975(+)